MNVRVSFTRSELIELVRALDLIAQEDANAEVNMEADEVRAKDSARKKLQRAMARLQSD